MKLRSYQEQAFNQVVARARAGVRSMLVSMPTGTGKTILFSHLASRAKSTLILAHRDELIQQAVEKFSAVWEIEHPHLSAPVGIVKAARREWNHRVVVASVQSLRDPSRIPRDKFSLCITDEAHHAAAPSYRAIYDAQGIGSPDGPFHLGVTATPIRGDGKGLGGVFDECCYYYALADAIADGWLCPLVGVRVQTEVDLGTVRRRGGDYAPGELERVVNVENRNRLIVESWHEHCAGRQTVAFTVGVNHARSLATEFQRSGVAALPVSGRLPVEVRRHRIRDFRQRRVQVLCNAQLLTEGWDEPGLSAVVLARPTQSQALYIQQVGRGTRTYPGKTDCIVLDLADVTGQHSVVQLADLFPDNQPEETGDEPEKKARKSLFGRGPGTRGVGHNLVSQHADLLHAGGAGQWTESEPGTLVLEWKGKATFGRVELRRTPSGWWQPWLEARSVRGGRGPISGQKGRPLPLGWAQAAAESLIKTAIESGLTLVDPNAAWRDRPASEKQVSLLRRLKVPFEPTITAGAAADRLTRILARPRRAKSRRKHA